MLKRIAQRDEARCGVLRLAARDAMPWRAKDWGDFEPRGLSRALLRACGALSPRFWAQRRVYFGLRKILGWTLHRRPIDVLRLGARLRLMVGNNVSERRILFNECFFDLDERRLLDSELPTDAVFIDAGANVGGYSFRVANSRPLSRVVAIEAHPMLFERLLFNIQQNPRMRIIPVHCPVAGEGGEVKLFINEENLGESSIRIVSPSGDFVRVAAKPLLQIAIENDLDRIDGLKLDVEGVELEVLTAFFAQAPRTLFPNWLLVERHKANAAVFFDLCDGQRCRLHAELRNNLAFRIAADTQL